MCRGTDLLVGMAWSWLGQGGKDSRKEETVVGCAAKDVESAKGDEGMRSCGEARYGGGLLDLTRGETWSDAVLTATKARSRARARPKREVDGRWRDEVHRSDAVASDSAFRFARYHEGAERKARRLR